MKEPESAVRDLLHQWVPEEQWETYDLHGFYVKDIPELDARVISINTESCDYRNDFLWAQLSDPNG
jgi:sphingomyelin phosphodiesterase